MAFMMVSAGGLNTSADVLAHTATIIVRIADAADTVRVARPTTITQTILTTHTTHVGLTAVATDRTPLKCLTARAAVRRVETNQSIRDMSTAAHITRRLTLVRVRALVDITDLRAAVTGQTAAQQAALKSTRPMLATTVDER